MRLLSTDILPLRVAASGPGSGIPSQAWGHVRGKGAIGSRGFSSCGDAPQAGVVLRRGVALEQPLPAEKCLRAFQKSPSSGNSFHVRVVEIKTNSPSDTEMFSFSATGACCRVVPTYGSAD
jgi:hypothetical protein